MNVKENDAVRENIIRSIKDNSEPSDGMFNGDAYVDNYEIILAASNPEKLTDRLYKWLSAYDRRLLTGKRNRIGLVFYRQKLRSTYLVNQGIYVVAIDRERLDGFLNLL